MNKQIKRFMFALIVTCVALLATARAQSPGPPPDRPLDEATRKAALAEILQNISERYVFPDAAPRIVAALRTRIEAGEYDKLTTVNTLADAMTKHLYEASKDKHLYLRPGGARPGGLPPDFGRAGNFAMPKAEVLPGNIGYLQVNGWPQTDLAGPTFAAAMAFLANTDALIIDLRGNKGGAVQMVAEAVSYFVAEKPVHLITSNVPRTGTKNESWTREKIAGPRYLNRPVFLLTSGKTFSGGEEFAYDMQALKRATLIGETTGGGAHPVQLYSIQGVFTLGVPFAEVKNAVTGTSWEGVGVKPDVAVPAAEALAKAQELAAKAVTGEVAKPAVAEGSFKFPETPAGKTFAAFLKAFNTGDQKALRDFHTAHGASPVAAGENAAQDLNFFQQSGGFTPHSIIKTDDYLLELLLQTKNGEWLNFTLIVEKTAPHGIAELRAQPAQAPK